MNTEHTEEELEILKKWFAIPEEDAWKWKVTVYEDGAIGIGRITLDELLRYRTDRTTGNI